MLKTLKGKLIASFVLINILIITSSFFNYSKIGESVEAFTQYREMARTSANSGVFTTNISQMRIAIRDYLIDSSDESVQTFKRLFRESNAAIKEVRAVSTNDEILDYTQQISDQLSEYSSAFNEIQQLATQRNQLIDEVIVPNGIELENGLTAVMRSSFNSMVFEVSNEASEALRSLMLARLYTNRFIETNAIEDMDRVFAEFDVMSGQVDELKDLVISQAGKNKLDELLQLKKTYQDGVRELYEIINLRNQIINSDLQTLGNLIDSEALSILELAKDRQDTLGPQIQENNSNILLIVLVVAVVITLLGILLAIFIPRLISAGIESIQQTLFTIGKTGQFNIRADERREDEIGKMAKVLNQTLAQIQEAVQEANMVVSSLAKGDFTQLITVEVSGDLQTLKEGVNTSVNSIAHTMSEISRVLDAMNEGRFDVVVDANVEGQFKHIMDNTSNTTKNLNGIISDINDVMHHMQQGDFAARVDASATGQLADLKSNINSSMDSLEKAIEDITHMVVSQSKGDLTHQITNQYPGQLDTLTKAINRSVSRLAEVVAQVLDATEIVAGAASEVSKGSMDLSDRVQQQASALEETSATMNQMNSAVQGNSKNSQQASQVATEVQVRAHEGVKVMQETIEAMNSIQDSSHKIADIVNLIDGIAFQTNLLALNAAVEAARAGEHGRGFAVVASEVRSLAQKSAEAAKDIKGLIEESVARIDQGSQLATQSGDMLNEINGEIESFSKMIGEIAHASQEQAEGVNQVHAAIGQIDSVTQQNAALVEETSSAAASLTEQSDVLKTDMNFFHIDATQRVNRAQVEVKTLQTIEKTGSNDSPVSHNKVAKLASKPAIQVSKEKKIDKPVKPSSQAGKPTEPVKTIVQKPRGAMVDEQEQWDEF